MNDRFKFKVAAVWSIIPCVCDPVNIIVLHWLLEELTSFYGIGIMEKKYVIFV